VACGRRYESDGSCAQVLGVALADLLEDEWLDWHVFDSRRPHPPTRARNAGVHPGVAGRIRRCTHALLPNAEDVYAPTGPGGRLTSALSWKTMEAVRARPRRQLGGVRAAATTVAALASAPACLVFLVLAVYVYGYRCNESCGGTGPGTAGWVHTRDSPAWSVHFWLMAVPCLIAMVLFVCFLAAGRPRRAAAALGAAWLAFAAWLLYPSLTGGSTGPGHWHLNVQHPGTMWVLLAVLVLVLGAVGALLAELLATRRAASGAA
jgi:hypothetical protein